MLTLLTTVLLTLSPAPPQPVSNCPAPVVQEPEQPSFEQRLELLVELMEAERVANHIPGFALAVVKGDEIVLSKGFGVADVKSSRPVTAQTLFAIGSTTKALTATALGMLQDDGVLDFDDPIAKYLPYFDLQIKTEGGDQGPVTLRDLMCHRTGFTRMSALWAGAGASRQLVLETASKAEPTAAFRKQFQYNNVMFLAAGMAGAQAAGVEWEELVQTRIFDPLGMSSSNFAIQVAQKDPRLSLGYEWEPEAEEYIEKRMLDLGAIAPAGSINSNVTDMAQWVRFQLAQGKLGEEQLIREETLKEIHSANMEMSEDSQYGLGWMIHGSGEEQVIEHGGNIDGFGAQVAFMPSKNLGYVLLTNVTATPLQASSMSVVFDTLLKDIADSADAVKDIEAYVGDYEANFAPFDGASFEVSTQDGKLFVNVPGQMDYELKHPDAEGKWFFKMTNAIAVSFDFDSSGTPTTLKMHQGGAIMELVREGVELPIEIPLADLEKFLGVFHDPALKEDVEVVIANNRLAVDIPSQRVYELHAPDEQGKRQLRMISWIEVFFNEDVDGDVTSITMYEKGSERELARVREASASTEAEELPTLAQFYEVLQQGGRARLLAEHGTLRARGTFRMPQSGIEGSYIYEARQEPRDYRLQLDMGVFGETQVGVRGDLAWGFNRAQGYQELTGKRRTQTLRGHPSIADGDWRESFDSVVIKGSEELNGVQCLTVSRSVKDLPSSKAYVDLATGEVLRIDGLFVHGTMQIPTKTTFEDFAEVNGVNVAHRITEGNSVVGETIMLLKDLEVGIELAEDFASFEAQGKDKVEGEHEDKRK